MNIPKKPGKQGILDVWNRSRTLFPRNNDGELLPRAVPLLGSIEEEIVMIPLTIAQLNEIRINIKLGEYKLQNLSSELIKLCLKYPSIKQISAIKPDYYERIKLTLLFECGFDIFTNKKSSKNTKQSERRQLYDLFLQDEGYALQAVLLHELGYTYFTIPKLTKYEIKLLLSSNKKIQIKRNQPQK